MRPVVRGNIPKDDNDQPREYTDYKQARGALINRLGEYCSYCEMELDSSLAVEHVKPKKPPGADNNLTERELNWYNFLLACTNCNAYKSNEEVELENYFWPDTDNPFWALKYHEGGVITPAAGLPETDRIRAENTIKLTGLDKTPATDAEASDRRWDNRRNKWNIAQRARERLQRNNNEDFREQIVETALGHGYWSIWMTVFSNDTDMCRRLIQAFAGTCQSCFAMEDNCQPLPRSAEI